ncbi:hypothetical protein DICPUDRAFT_82731 [Dictyostelium purpureum]|uniref:Uncharacterized protein n=1 Tax=Dictyostelium purpureum TaxID=5786 RepID=F0ZXE6_DICPU|nr:uncharacterized protein DICPUDRAFT_82731 [Dictyostelium purpureum]EGC31392.1 hypothetical protein DICPUDRAFT_82731 [Dictyostelium purpureum]|eukprot:XP_003292090.1 hypothetical protein DICPUDRAFT_82731 [Dictyostelium purpureum]
MSVDIIIRIGTVFIFLDFFLSSVLKEYFLNLSEDDQDNGEYDTLVEYLNKILEYLIKLYKGNKSEIIDSNSYLNSIKSILNFIVFLKTSKRIDNIKKNIIELLSTIVRESDEISDIYILNIFMDFKRILGNDLNTFFEEHYLILKEQKMKTSSTESPIIIIYLGFFKNKGPYYFLRDLYYNFIEEFLEIFLSKDDFKNIHFIIEIVSPLPSKEIAQKYFLLLLDLVNKKEKILNIDYFKCLNIFLDNNKLQLDKSILNDHQFQLNILKRMDYFLEEKNDELCEIISKKLGEYMPVLHYKYISLVIIDKPPINSSSKNYDLFLHPIVNILENDYDYFNEFLTHKQCHSFISNLKKVLFLSSCSVKLINLFFASQLCKNKSILSTEKKSLATTYIESFQKDFERHFNSLILINKPMNREFIVGFLTLTFLIYNLIKIIPENNLSLPYVKEITQILSPFQKDPHFLSKVNLENVAYIISSIDKNVQLRNKFKHHLIEMILNHQFKRNEFYYEYFKILLKYFTKDDIFYLSIDKIICTLICFYKEKNHSLNFRKYIKEMIKSYGSNVLFNSRFSTLYNFLSLSEKEFINPNNILQLNNNNNEIKTPTLSNILILEIFKKIIECVDVDTSSKLSVFYTNWYYFDKLSWVFSKLQYSNINFNLFKNNGFVIEKQKFNLVKDSCPLFLNSNYFKNLETLPIRWFSMHFSETENITLKDKDDLNYLENYKNIKTLTFETLKSINSPKIIKTVSSFCNTIKKITFNNLNFNNSIEFDFDNFYNQIIKYILIINPNIKIELNIIISDNFNVNENRIGIYLPFINSIKYYKNIENMQTNNNNTNTINIINNYIPIVENYNNFNIYLYNNHNINLQNNLIKYNSIKKLLLSSKILYVYYLDTSNEFGPFDISEFILNNNCNNNDNYNYINKIEEINLEFKFKLFFELSFAHSILNLFKNNSFKKINIKIQFQFRYKETLSSIELQDFNYLTFFQDLFNILGSSSSLTQISFDLPFIFENLLFKVKKQNFISSNMNPFLFFKIK